MSQEIDKDVVVSEENLNEVVSQLNDSSEVIDVEVATTDDEDYEYDYATSVKDEVVFEYDKIRKEDDGYLGKPIFTDDEKHVLTNNLYVDISVIENAYMFMKTAMDSIKVAEEELDEKAVTSAKNLYIANRNILVQLQKSYDEYIGYIDENKNEIIKKYKDAVGIVAQNYIKNAEEEFHVKYIPNTFMNFVFNISMRREIKRMKTEQGYINPIVSIFTRKSTNNADVEFQKDINRITSPVRFMISNISNCRTLKSLSTDEKNLAKFITAIVKKFRKITPSTKEVDESFKDIFGGSRGLFMSFVYKLANIVGKGPHSEFGKEKIKYEDIINKTTSNYFKRNKQIKGKEKKKISDEISRSVVLPDSLIKSRINLTISELYLKNWFSLSLIGDPNTLSDKHKFMSILHEIDKKFSIQEIFYSITNTLSFNLVFKEFEEIVKGISLAHENIDIYNAKQLNYFKNTLAFIYYFQESLVAHDYGDEEIYNEYVTVLKNSINSGLKKIIDS